jgi:shikimate kinase
MAEIARIARRLDRPVVLVGMMGVGKTTVGRKLASLLDVPFIDADEEIERAAQMPIPEIFATYGEPYFRSGERRVIARLLDGATPARRKVLATGGGASSMPKPGADSRQGGVGVARQRYRYSGRACRPQGQPPLLRGGNPREIPPACATNGARPINRPRSTSPAATCPTGSRPAAS